MRVLRVSSGSPLIGKTLEALGYVQPIGFTLSDLRRHNGERAEIKAETRLEDGDALIFSGELESIPDLWGTEGIEPRHGLGIDEMYHIQNLWLNANPECKS